MIFFKWASLVSKLSLALLLLSTAFTGSVAIASPIIDQSQLVQNITGSNDATRQVGQSFTPSLAGIDFIAFSLGSARGTVNAFVNIRDSSAGNNFGGALLGTSNIVSFTVGFQDVMFEFSSTIAMTPGALYVAEIVMDAAWIINANNQNPYAGGSVIDGLSPGPIPEIDLVFWEGVNASAEVPEPSSIALALLGFAAMAGALRRKSAASN